MCQHTQPPVFSRFALIACCSKRHRRIEAQDDGELITTTDIDLARALGEAIHHAYQGKLEFHYNEEEDLLSVSWTH